MQPQETLEKIVEMGVVPVVATDSAENAVLVVEAVYRSGIRVIEINMSVPNSVSVLETLVRHFGDKVLFGGGTVLNPETARACIQAGAEYVIAPSLNLRTIELVKHQSKAMIPGALTPTEVLTGWDAGADAVMIFPCGAVGGPKYMASLKHTFPQIKMMPTGSLNLETMSAFLKAGACAVAIGAAFIDAANIAAGNYQVFEERARRYIAEVARARSRPA